jgi:hypothetical protein
MVDGRPLNPTSQRYAGRGVPAVESLRPLQRRGGAATSSAGGVRLGWGYEYEE